MQARGWIRIIDEILDANHLAPGRSSKLAGKLSWVGAQLFNRIGRAMLRPLFDQKTRRDGAMNNELRRALQWWKRILSEDIAEKRLWMQDVRPPAHMFCDARGHPAHVAAVLYIDGGVYWAHMQPAASIIELFRARRDNQIMGLELLSISLGLNSFAQMIAGRNLIIHSDNSGSEVCLRSQHSRISVCSCAYILQVALRRGTARAMDHAQLVHEQWLSLALLGCSVHVKRVGTHDNIADLPSREDFRILRARKTIEVHPQLSCAFECPETWEALKERWDAFQTQDKTAQLPCLNVAYR